MAETGGRAGGRDADCLELVVVVVRRRPSHDAHEAWWWRVEWRVACCVARCAKESSLRGASHSRAVAVTPNTSTMTAHGAHHPPPPITIVTQPVAQRGLWAPWALWAATKTTFTRSGWECVSRGRRSSDARSASSVRRCPLSVVCMVA